MQGKLTCHEEPLGTTSDALLPLVRLGQVNKALKLQQQVSKRLARDEDPVASSGDHVRFLAIVGDTARAKRLLERYLPAAVDAVSAMRRLGMYEGAILLLDRMATKGPAVKLQTPKGWPQPDAQGRHEIGPLRAWILGEARAIARQFDARNGNRDYEQDLDRLPELLELTA